MDNKHGLIRDVTLLLQCIEPTPFEYFVADLLECGDWETEVTKQSGDGGTDIFAHRDEFPYCKCQRTHIQARRFSANNIQANTLRDSRDKIYRNYDEVEQVVIISTGQVTDQAQITADRESIGIWSGKDVSRYLVRHEAFELLDEHIDLG